MTSLETAVSPSQEIQIPSTPIPAHASLPSQHDKDSKASRQTSLPPQSSSADMTPPPSSQKFAARSPPAKRRTLSQSAQLPASPPATVKLNSSASIPSVDDVAEAGEDELRSMVGELATAVRDARMSAAHFKLQHNLLMMESHESAQRAEVEHQMTRREVEVLQAETRSRQQTPRGVQASPRSATEPLFARCRELELENQILTRRLETAKALIDEERDKYDLVLEENLRLKRRIRENRDHYARLKAASPAFSSPPPPSEFMTPQRRTVARFPYTGESQTTGIDSILAAAGATQTSNAEPLSVPSTPTKTPTSRFKHGHIRGAYSLSSLQSTPTRPEFGRFSAAPSLSQPLPPQQQRQPFPSSAPAPIVSHRYQAVEESSRHDRDSTISISGSEHGSDDEDHRTHDTEDRGEAVTDDELPQSQASSLATSLLRKFPGGRSQSSQPASANQSQNFERSSLPPPPPLGSQASVEKQSNLLQTKLFGHVTKKISSNGGGKRRASFGEDDIAEKKRRLKAASHRGHEGVGLGIAEAFSSPRR